MIDLIIVLNIFIIKVTSYMTTFGSLWKQLHKLELFATTKFFVIEFNGVHKIYDNFSETYELF